MLPQTWIQVLVVILGVVPGFVYQITRRALRGPSPDEIDITIRILRSIATSALFAGAYFLVFGSWLITILQRHPVTYYSPQKSAAAALLLVLIFPWIAARVIYYVSTAKLTEEFRNWLIDKLKLRRHYDPTPSGWDFAFRNRGPGWVRILTKDGRWVGGWFGTNSFASSYPAAREIFLEISYQMGDEGEFTGEVSGQGGTYIFCDDIVLIEFPTSEKEESSDGIEENDSRS